MDKNAVRTTRQCHPERSPALIASYVLCPTDPTRSSQVRSPEQRCPALFGAARAGVVLRYATFDAVPPEAFPHAANATYTNARSALAGHAGGG